MLPMENISGLGPVPAEMARVGEGGREGVSGRKEGRREMKKGGEKVGRREE